MQYQSNYWLWNGKRCVTFPQVFFATTEQEAEFLLFALSRRFSSLLSNFKLNWKHTNGQDSNFSIS